jgi:hypothetical protein
VKKRFKQGRQAQRGAALVIAIFTLMLISVVATAMILMADSETALKGNYKSAMQAFYYAKAGLEEGRGRLFWPNPNIPNPVVSCVFPAPGAVMPTNRVCYILNPSPGEVVDPTDQSSTNLYADTEYQTEWNAAIPVGTGYNTVLSNSPIAGTGIAGPLYKWVRITPRTEASSKMDVDGDGDPTDTNPLFYDGSQQLVSAGGAPVPNAAQVLTVTALAVTPYGSRRIVQYTVAPSAFAAALSTFPSALTLDGNGVSFTGPSGGNGDGNGNGSGGGSGNGNSTNFQIVGNDLNSPPGNPSGIPAIGYTNSGDYSNSDSGLSAAAASSSYVSPAGVPNVGLIPPSTPQIPSGLPLTLQTPSGLDAMVQAITANADKVVTGPVTQSDSHNIFPSGMSIETPMITVVNGDLTINAWHNTGYGLLLVTGQLKYDPDATWNGVILVIGKGVFVSNQNGTGQINGAVFVANTRDAAGNLLTNLGAASFSQTGGGYGIRYSSYWMKATQSLLPYQVLSFREIAQTTP